MADEAKEEAVKPKPSNELAALVERKRWRVGSFRGFGQAPTPDELRVHYGVRKEEP